MRRSKVRIKNPVPGGGDVTSINRARRFVAHGVAEFTSPEQTEIVFLDSPKQAVIVRSAEERLHAKITGVNVDNLKGTFFSHAAGLPMIRPHIMLRGKPAKEREGSDG
jgi:hypothetical protein